MDEKPGIKMLLRFSKAGPCKYIGHLDLLRVFQRTIRRAGLPAAYSQGFNPHILLSFALPLSLGMESTSDYAELTLARVLPPEEIISRFNAASPGGLELAGVRPADKTRSASVVEAADYAVELPQNLAPQAIEAAIAQLLAEKSITIPKKTKSGVKDTDIRPDIYAVRAAYPRVIIRLAAGSTRFLNPRTAAALILGRMGLNGDTVPITRLELFDARFVPLYETDTP